MRAFCVFICVTMWNRPTCVNGCVLLCVQSQSRLKVLFLQTLVLERELREGCGNWSKPRPQNHRLPHQLCLVSGDRHDRYGGKLYLMPINCSLFTILTLANGLFLNESDLFRVSQINIWDKYCLTRQHILQVSVDGDQENNWSFEEAFLHEHVVSVASSPPISSRPIVSFYFRRLKLQVQFCLDSRP